jgi:hypothetical protein
MEEAPDINLQITGETGDKRDENGRFTQGHSGNPAGRPRGLKNAASRAAAILLDGEAEALARKAVELALGGDPAMLRLCFDRLIGKRRGRPVDLELPPIETAADLAAAAVRVAEAAVQGAITPEEATVLCATLERCGSHLTRGSAWGGSNWQMWLEKLRRPGGSSQ